MLSIDEKNNITLTRGDTLTLELSLTNTDGTAYTPAEGDVIRIAISKGYVGESFYELIKTAVFDDLSVTIPASETETLGSKRYNYDVEITHSSGIVDTVISATLTMLGEAE